MDLASFLLATALAHVGFAIFVAAHASFTERNAGRWPYVTLALGLAGVAAYFFYDETSSDGNI
ncbi:MULTISPECIES: hypothetical protein [Natrialba]|uniref:Uncharacterized protein n=1 Tax=Natrialba swarupiae TaxID=2448032 RepID=A0A5D5AJG4_9EURY|nr:MULTISPECIES: hypothetical protein [Natrialba]MWV38537.1 hypothetical protein [Natrialba sp. INN-245]TYT61083.1 hypothetical protein FYC77_15435 [Natrialba swarupiae]